MQTKTIHLTIGTLATLCALPLAFLGLRSLWATPAPKSASTSHTARPAAGAPDAPSNGTVEIELTSGNGTDINRALRRLPERGGRVTLGQGVFETREPVVIDRDNVELRGSGKLTVLRLSDKADCPVLIIGPISTPPKPVFQVRLKHLVIDGNRRNQSPEREKEWWGGVTEAGGVSQIRTSALVIRGAQQLKVEGITTRNARNVGLVLEKGCRQVYLTDIESHDNQLDGLASYETEESYFYDLKLHSNQAAGMSLDKDFHHNVVRNAIIRNNGSQGVFMRDSNDNDFKRLEINRNGAQGIFIAQADNDDATRCTNNVFSDVTVMENRGVGLRLNDASCIENMVRNSLFRGNEPGNFSQPKEGAVTLTKVQTF